MTPNRSSDSCTTILVGKDASYDGSTIVARTEDSQNGVFTPKKFIVVQPEDQPRHYRSVLSSFEIDLPDNPVRYTAVPDAIPKDGIWGEAGINHYNVAMSETETITTNTEPMSLMEWLSAMSMRSGGWKLSEVIIGWPAVCQTMPM